MEAHAPSSPYQTSSQGYLTPTILVGDCFLATSNLGNHTMEMEVVKNNKKALAKVLIRIDELHRGGPDYELQERKLTEAQIWGVKRRKVDDEVHD